MAFDFGKEAFEPGNFEVLPSQVIAEIREMENGQIGFFDIDEMWIDDERKVWVDGRCHVLTYDEVMDEGEELDIKFARIIKIPEGFIVDSSHFQIYDYSCIDQRFCRLTIEEFEEDNPGGIPLPVIFLASNSDELELITEPLALQYNIDLRGTGLEDDPDSLVRSRNDEDDEDLTEVDED